MSNTKVVRWLRRDENILMTLGMSIGLVGVALVFGGLAPSLPNYIVLPVLGALAAGLLFMAYITNPWRKETKNESTTSS